jgi:hypothetical protein
MHENSAGAGRILAAGDAAKIRRGKAMGRASRIRARSALAAVAVMVMALAVFLGTAEPGFAAPDEAPGHTISTATTLETGVTETGGGGLVDFWKVPLSGGEQVNFTVNGSTAHSFYLDLYVPTTDDANFPHATAFTSGSTNYKAESTITLQAPYTGTFVLAVCEDVTTCNFAYKSVMGQYQLEASVASSPVAAPAAGATISAAPQMQSGDFEAGGANLVDFWRLNLDKGYKFQFTVNSSTVNSYTFDLYPPTTNDANFSKAAAVTAGYTNHKAQSTVTLEAPYTGNFVLAVCENVAPCNFYYKTVMNPYTFTTGLILP